MAPADLLSVAGVRMTGAAASQIDAQRGRLFCSRGSRAMETPPRRASGMTAGDGGAPPEGGHPEVVVLAMNKPPVYEVH